MYESGWGLYANSAEAKKWYAAARAIGSGGAAKRMRQMRAVAASKDPDPSPESRPKMPQNVNPPTVSAPVVEGSGSQSPVAMNTAPVSNNPVRNVEPRRASQNASDDDVSSSPSTFTATVTRRSPLTPVILIVFGVVMGITVFKWMRRGAYKSSAF